MTRIPHLFADYFPRGRSATAISITAFVDSTGTGVYIAGVSLFLLAFAGLDPVEVGIGLSIAGLSAFVSKLPAGSIADAFGAKRVLVVVQLARALCFAALAFTSDAPMFYLLSVALGLCEGPVSPLTQAVVASAVPEADRVQTLAVVRTVRNAAFTLGTLIAIPLLAFESDWAYRAIMLLNAASFVVAAVLLAQVRLIGGAQVSRKPSPFSMLTSVRDVRYMGLTALSGVMTIHIAVLLVGVPLWAITVGVPAALVPLLIATNTVLTVVLQVPASRLAEGPRGGPRAYIWSAVFLGGGFTLLAVTGLMDSHWLTLAILFIAIIALTVGEVIHSVGEWEVSYRYAPAENRALYLSSFSLGNAAMGVAGPLVVTAVIIPIGVWGWVAAASLMVACVPPILRLLRSLEQRRQHV